MQTRLQKDYPLLNLSETELDENTSLKKMLRLVGENKQVVEFGCATGYFAKLLTLKGCQVTGIEVNPNAAASAEQHCQKVIVADLDFVSVVDIFPEKSFDVAVFGDVLEHLRDPWKVLKETRQLLKPEGYVVASIPNIAHGAIRLALLQGKFEYTDLGILDNTHLRFFTRQTVEDLFDQAGYFLDLVERTKLPICSTSNLVPRIDKNSFAPKVIEQIEQDENVDTLQFIIRAFPVSIESKYAALNEKYYKLIDELNCLQNDQKQVKENLEKAQNQLQEKKSKIAIAQAQNEQQHAELELSTKQITEKQIQLEHSQSQLQQTQVELKHSQSQLQQAHKGWEICQNIIKAMESSKFWKMRRTWFRLKRYLGLRTD